MQPLLEKPVDILVMNGLTRRLKVARYMCCEVFLWTVGFNIFHCQEKFAEICRKHPDLQYCPLTRNLAKSDFDYFDQLSTRIKEDYYLFTKITENFS